MWHTRHAARVAWHPADVVANLFGPTTHPVVNVVAVVPVLESLHPF